MTDATPYSEMMIRIQTLRQRIDDANRALVKGDVLSLSRFPEEIASLCALAARVPDERRQQAAFALHALDADLNAYARILSTRRRTAAQARFFEGVFRP
jgi:hypothetical protein